MKKTEKIITAVTAVALGVLLVSLKGETLKILTSVLGITIVFLGVLDLFIGDKKIFFVKCGVGLLVVLFGFFILEAALYLIAAALVLFAIWQIYGYLKCGLTPKLNAPSIVAYAKSVLCILIGFFLFFNQCGEAEWVFVVAGIFTVIEGGVLLIDALAEFE
ncbi:MAG: hypothetical protein IJX98_03405 [Clostridia bacterium]|nr:hypothetical protein [Clostridia bacterium]